MASSSRLIWSDIDPLFATHTLEEIHAMTGRDVYKLQSRKSSLVRKRAKESCSGSDSIMLRGQRGYVVHPKHLASLEAELRRRGVEYRLVDVAEGLGEWPRPVLVTEGVKPHGWIRYGNCNRCGSLFGLGSGGFVQTACIFCSLAACKQLSSSKLWYYLESNSRWETLGLSWLDDAGVSTVYDVRDKLAGNDLRGVGPERAEAVAEALKAWRVTVLEELAKS